LIVAQAVQMNDGQPDDKRTLRIEVDDMQTKLSGRRIFAAVAAGGVLNPAAMAKAEPFDSPNDPPQGVGRPSRARPAPWHISVHPQGLEMFVRRVRALAAVVIIFAIGNNPSVAANDPTQVRVPADLETPRAVQAGAHHFRQTCVPCHGAPGIAPSVKGLSPSPPNLLAEHRRNEPADVFGKVEHGISGTAMPAFRGKLSDESVWEIAAFLHHSRGITADAFAALSTAKVTAQSQP
jgi:mono/diheme cytochrome c family protein